MKNKKINICATIYRIKRNGIKRIVFRVGYVDEVEMQMTHLGYGCRDYWLKEIPEMKRVRLRK
jgi:hypothetical protein